MSDADKTETVEIIRYTADVVAVTTDGRVLLIERGWPPYEGAWALPGGHVDPGETSREAAARELEEETGVRVAAADLRQIGVWDEPGRDPRGRYVTVAYLAVVPAGTAAAAGDDARAARWWPTAGLPPRLAFDHADILSAALAGQFRSPICSAYEGGFPVTNETVRVKVLLLVGAEAEIVADAADAAAPVRYPAADIADAVGVAVADLPGVRLVAEVGADDRLSGWKLA